MYEIILAGGGLNLGLALVAFALANSAQRPCVGARLLLELNFIFNQDVLSSIDGTLCNIKLLIVS
jgi:hypothetical protein